MTPLYFTTYQPPNLPSRRNGAIRLAELQHVSRLTSSEWGQSDMVNMLTTTEGIIQGDEAGDMRLAKDAFVVLCRRLLNVGG